MGWIVLANGVNAQLKAPPLNYRARALGNRLTAALLTKGTRTRTATATAQAIEALGGELNTNAGWDASEATVTVISSEQNAPAEFIVNPDEQSDAAKMITVSVDATKRAFIVTNERTKERWSYPLK